MTDAIREYAERFGIDLTEQQAAAIQQLENDYASIGYLGFSYHLFRLILHWSAEDILAHWMRSGRSEGAEKDGADG